MGRSRPWLLCAPFAYAFSPSATELQSHPFKLSGSSLEHVLLKDMDINVYDAAQGLSVDGALWDLLSECE